MKVLLFLIDIEGGEAQGPEKYNGGITDGGVPKLASYTRGVLHEEMPLPSF